MSRPLLISDCDEVLLHLVAHFAEWIDEAHDYDFVLEDPGFMNSVRNRATGLPVPNEEVWPLLDAFFMGESHRQNVVPGAVEALGEIGRVADIVILTNLPDEHQALRVRQLEAFEIRHQVFCNQGSKGPQVKELVERLKPSVTVFVDDHPGHHASVAEEAPAVWRLHMVADPRLADHIPPSPHAHARIDSWDEALGWILERFRQTEVDSA
jgi:hypothetical protein